jgi:hypothetical protein
MTTTLARLFTAASLLILGACSAHNPFIITNQTISKPVSTKTFEPHSEKVLFLTQSLPEPVRFELISQIDVGKIWYGSAKKVYESMATRARELGANAVIQFKSWKQPSGFSWAAPHGTGQAVHVEDLKQLEAMGVQGSWH